MKSATTGSRAAASRASPAHRPTSSAEISEVSHVRTPAASTAATSGSLRPMSPVPRTQPMMAWAMDTRLPHRSTAHLLTMASKAALTSP